MTPLASWASVLPKGLGARSQDNGRAAPVADTMGRHPRRCGWLVESSSLGSGWEEPSQLKQSSATIGKR